MNSKLDAGQFASALPRWTPRTTQMEFAFARTAGVTVENLKRLRALRRARLPVRPCATGLAPLSSAGGSPAMRNVL